MEINEREWIERLRRWGLWARSGGRRQRTSSLWLVMRQATPQEGSSAPGFSQEECMETDRLIVAACDDVEKELLRARYVNSRSAKWIEEHLKISHRELRQRLINSMIKLDKRRKIIIIRAQENTV